MSLQIIVHYSLHFLAPMLIAYWYARKNFWKVYWVMLATMLVDLDHLLAEPMFDPNRCSINFHPLHSYWAIGVYFIIVILPYEKWGWAWWWRPIGIGLLFHMFTDFQDYYLWNYLL
ncbi:DUF6122 family protein [Porphyromonas circumdentaria]|uniref:DUF6122 family protein n=1 Tax=Porphyromonas circumdentaria TaxID=29524 RepID=UPI0026DB9E06|nr:DUF6122 family protein [Porphyromonas circumdentaria]MDO4721938.1 DUF6122 family protein [Porphyromonas circumdentaria]